MKTRSIIGLVALIALFCNRAFGQISTFALDNAIFVQAPVFDAEGVPLGPDYRAELWGSRTPDSLVPAYDFRTGNRIMEPFLIEGYFTTGREMVVPAQGTDGGYSWLQLRAWDFRLGGTYEEVAGLNMGGYGESSLFYADGGNPLASLPELPGPLYGLESFRLRPVPEPSTWALLVLGGVAFCRGARRREGSER